MRGGVLAFVPVQIDPAIEIVFEVDQGFAIDAVDHNALAAIGDAHDPLAGHWLTARRAAERLAGA